MRSPRARVYRAEMQSLPGQGSSWAGRGPGALARASVRGLAVVKQCLGRLRTALRCPCGTGQLTASSSSIPVALEHCLKEGRGNTVLFIGQVEISLGNASLRDHDSRVAKGLKKPRLHSYSSPSAVPWLSSAGSCAEVHVHNCHNLLRQILMTCAQVFGFGASAAF